MQVSLTYSRDSITKQIAAGSTLADLATSVNLAYLGAPTENIRFTSGGVELEKTATLYDGMEVYIEPKSHSKA